MKRIRMVCILVGSILAAFLVPLAARAWLASPRPVEAPLKAIVGWDSKSLVISQNVYTDSMQFYPALAVVSPTVCVAWSRQVADNAEYYDPYYKSSPAGMWRGQVNIDSTSPITTETTRVDVAVDGDEKLHFVWSEYTKTPSYTLYYSYTNATGVEEIVPGGVGDELLSPAIAVSDDDNQVHVVWSQESSIKYVKKTIGGVFGSSTNITSSTSMAINSDIAVTGAGIAHVVWSEGNPGSADIFYANDSNWSSTLRKVSDDVSHDGRSPAIAVSGLNVYVVWTEWIGEGNQYIRFQQSTDGGSNWGDSVRISGRFAANEDSPTFLRPAIAVDSNEKIHVAFNGAGATGDPEDIYYASKTQIGSWQCCRNLTYNVDGNNTTPDIATSGEDVHLVWAGPPPFLDPEGNDYEVYYKHTVTLGEGVYLPIILKSY